jgi:AraC family transcriptional regulator of adaptative response / DNA-3-methyladenine glycosylase II
MGEVALAAGFGCVRRFNAAMRNAYKRTPTQIRRLVKHSMTQPENEYIFHLRFRPPYHWQGMLAFLAVRAVPGVEAVRDNAYLRSISVDGITGHFEVSLDEENNSLRARIQFGDPRSLFFIVERIRAMFDLNSDWTDIAAILKTDPALTRLVESAPGMRVPGCWSGFELATRAILGQQITVRGGTALAGRIVKAFGPVFTSCGELTHLFPTPEILADADLSAIGMPRARRETIRALAREVRDGHLKFEGIVESNSFLERLMEIPGIGRWTAQYVAMRALREPDAFPVGDAALLSALKLDDHSQLESRAESWRPWRSYATMYLWTGGDRKTEVDQSPSVGLTPRVRAKARPALSRHATVFNSAR